MAYCLLPDKIDEFKQALKDKDIKIADLLNMTTEERTNLFEKYAGNDASKVNLLFEEKLVLKNKMQGIKNWASKVGEIGRYDPAKKAQFDQLLSEYKSKQQERIFSPKEHESFLNDLADSKLGTHITREEAHNIFELSNKTEELKKNFDPKKEEWSSDKDKAEYGASKVALEKYTDSLKEGKFTLKNQFKQGLSEIKQKFEEDKFKGVSALVGKTIKTITDNSVALVASLDDSFIGRQGLHTLMTHPSIWWDGAKNSITDFAKTVGGQETKDALMADVYSNPNYLNGEYDKAKILNKTEEQFPTSLPERVPVLGRAFKASQAAFEGSAIRMRTGLYDLISDQAKNNGVDMNDTQIKDIGTLVNAVTARGNLGRVGESPLVKAVLWAPKMLKANWDVLTGHTLGTGLETSFVRKQAAINLVKIIATSAAIMTIANAIKPGSAETNPLGTNFGKIKVGNTTFDYSGGAGSLITFAARLEMNKTKNPSGVITPYGTGFGQQTRFDALIDFLTNKTTPAARVAIDLLKGIDFKRDKVTLGGELSSVVTPISIQNLIQLKDDHSVSAVIGVISDALGANANTYTTTKDWNQNPGVELQAFQQKVGAVKFKQANDSYNKQVNDWLDQVKNNQTYKNLSEDDKQKVITAKKSKIKDTIFKQYGFTYKAPKTKPLPKL